MEREAVDEESNNDRWNSEEAAITMDIINELSLLLDTGLDKTSLKLLVELIEWGVHPEALAATTIELHKELHELKRAEMESFSTTLKQHEGESAAQAVRRNSGDNLQASMLFENIRESTAYPNAPNAGTGKRDGPAL